MRISCLLLSCVLVLAQQQEEDSSLFTPSLEFPVLGPTIFPKPTDMVGLDAVVALQPTFGRHRPNEDAVMAYAEGYPIENYLIFIESLRQTGFTGDIVLAIASLDTLEKGVEDYLRSRDHVVAYATNFTCSTDHFKTTSKRTQDGGGKMSFQMCKLHDIYGTRQQDGSIHTVQDPRMGRVVATLRYELYWIWTLQYNPNSWLMLLDARDSYFQRNPFQQLPRSTNKNSGQLYFFGVSMILLLHIYIVARMVILTILLILGKCQFHSFGHESQESQMVGAGI